MLVFASVGALIATNSSTNHQPKLSSLATTGTADVEPSNPLDQLSSADIAVNVARLTSLPEATSVTNTADSENASLSVASADDSVVSKPQIISDGLKSNRDITHYEVEAGDTVQSVAEKFGITSSTIKLSNNLEGDSLTSGMDLLISPVNGLVYRVQPGDTPESLARKYHTNADQIIAFNDTELTGKLKPGDLIVIPDGTQAAERRFSYEAARGAGRSGAVFSFGGGNYAFGWCTYYASARSGAPGGWGNAYTWDDLAPLSGWSVSSIPRVGAIGQSDRNHVGIVEAVRKVNGHYEFQYSDMNGLSGFNAVGYSRDKLPNGGWVTVSYSTFNHFIYH